MIHSKLMGVSPVAKCQKSAFANSHCKAAFDADRHTRFKLANRQTTTIDQFGLLWQCQSVCVASYQCSTQQKGRAYAFVLHFTLLCSCCFSPSQVHTLTHTTDVKCVSLADLIHRFTDLLLLLLLRQLLRLMLTNLAP